MNYKLLTIVVPTYNRVSYLKKLLPFLASELSDFSDQVDLIVLDNASTDDTFDLIGSYLTMRDWFNYIRHEVNIGPDLNFIKAIELSRSRFVWILSDDDCMLPGVLRSLISHLSSNDASLVFLKNKWLLDIYGSHSCSSYKGSFVELSLDDFIKDVNVWMTFISSMVINRTKLLDQIEAADLYLYCGTQLTQLSWILPLLTETGSFYVSSHVAIFATKENSGGYDIFRVFGYNFPNILGDFFSVGSKRFSMFVNSYLLSTLLPLAWSIRQDEKSNRFLSLDPVLLSETKLSSFIRYRFIIVPILRFWRPAAYLLYKIVRFVSVIQSRMRVY